MRNASVIFALGLLAACADKPELSCATDSPIEGITPAIEMSDYADDISARASELYAKLSEDEELAGPLAYIAKNFADTDSYHFASQLIELERRIALQTAREQATVNDGPPLVDPEQSWACEMLAVKVASLDHGQSSGQLLRHLKQIERYFGPQYPYREKHRDLE